MAKVICTELQKDGASGPNITLDTSKNVTCENNLTVDGTSTLTGAVTLPDNTITNAKVADDAIGVAELSASGTASGTTYLRGDNTWATVPAGLTYTTTVIDHSSTNSFEITGLDGSEIKQIWITFTAISWDTNTDAYLVFGTGSTSWYAGNYRFNRVSVARKSSIAASISNTGVTSTDGFRVFYGSTSESNDQKSWERFVISKGNAAGSEWVVNGGHANPGNDYFSAGYGGVGLGAELTAIKMTLTNSAVLDAGTTTISYLS